MNTTWKSDAERSASLFFERLGLVKGWVGEIYVFLIHFIFRKPDRFAETLKMNDFPFTEKSNNIVHVGIVTQPEDIIIGHSGLLLCGKIFGKIRDHIAFDTDGRRIPGCTGSKLGKYPCGVIHEVRGKIRHSYIVFLDVAGQLMNDRADNLQVGEFFRTNQRVKMNPQISSVRQILCIN